MIGIIGYGFVGKAVNYGFRNIKCVISDPKYNSTTVADVCLQNPEAIFVCVPTPTDDTNYSVLKDVLSQIKSAKYQGLVVVKSTILPHHLQDYDIIYNPEFLSRKTYLDDFVKPPFVLFGGDKEKCNKLLEVYKNYSHVDLSNVKITDIKTASMAKYTFNTFFATKLIFMNQLYDVTQKVGVDFDELKSVLKMNPWMMGVSHLDVPGHEGRGFSGPCLPKDTEAFNREFNLPLLQTVLDLNNEYRKMET